MVRLDNAGSVKFRNLSFNVGPGTMGVILTASDADRAFFVRILTAKQKPDTGEVYLLETNLYDLSPHQTLALFRDTGFVTALAVPLSNLPLWDNIVLPACYHKGKSPDELEEPVARLFEQTGIPRHGLSSYLARLPGGLSPGKCKALCLIRAMLMEPRLMVYESFLEGLTHEEARTLTALATWYHRQRPDRACLFVESRDDILSYIEPEVLLRQTGSTFILETRSARKDSQPWT